jgi:mannose-6-phosphate isomerase-like protein (cupin superfamily)
VSYPEARYNGSMGEVLASWRPADQGPDPGIGAAPHFHRTMSESFFVVSGRVELYDGRRWIDAGPGDFVHVPEGGVHGFRNESDEPASMLILFAPGAPREGYFEAIAERVAGRAYSDEEWTALCERHDNYFVP